MKVKYQNQGNRGTKSEVIDTKTCFVVAILNFLFLNEHRLNDVVAYAIFEFSTLKNPLGQMFMLLSGSAHIEEQSINYFFGDLLINPIFVYINNTILHSNNE